MYLGEEEIYFVLPVNGNRQSCYTSIINQVIHFYNSSRLKNFITAKATYSYTLNRRRKSEKWNKNQQWIKCMHNAYKAYFYTMSISKQHTEHNERCPFTANQKKKKQPTS